MNETNVYPMAETTCGYCAARYQFHLGEVNPQCPECGTRALPQAEEETSVESQGVPPPLPLAEQMRIEQAARRASLRLAKEKKEKRFILLMIGGIAATLLMCWCAAQFMDSWSGGGDSQDFNAYCTAEGFIKKQIVGAREISSFKESVVTHEGDKYYVAVQVDGLNAFGGPVRQGLIVEMELVNGGKTWRLVEIHRK